MSLGRMESPKAVYIHIPFCTNKCYYCDFNSVVLKGQPVMDYLKAMEREMERTVSETPPGVIRSIFVGGGTPTVLTAEQMAYFLGTVREHFPHWAEDMEFTMEANPGTVDEDKLRVMKEGGVNRISFGVQSFDDGLLKTIGRIHDTGDVYRSLEAARSVGFDNISIDLMFGLPRQTLEQLDRTLTAALELSLPHYSIYSLKIEENTLFHTLYQRNELPLPDEDTELAMYERIIERMRQAGYDHYEISNFAKPGYESRHNMTYWRNEPYYGIGAGAHGYVRGRRHMNIKGVQPYIKAAFERLPVQEQFTVDEREAMEDFMMVGLRMLRGVRDEDFIAQFGVKIEEVFGAQVADLCGRGLLERTAEGWKLSAQGLIYGNEVFGAFLNSGNE
jgi:oxygen-independent coproporphyrinogen-3 oxidase